MNTEYDKKLTLVSIYIEHPADCEPYINDVNLQREIINGVAPNHRSRTVIKVHKRTSDHVIL